jgi:hypothetical protein
MAVQVEHGRVGQRKLLGQQEGGPPKGEEGGFDRVGVKHVGGEARVREVAATLRAAGAPSSVIWTEDWKGGEETAFGYHLTAEWTVDTTLYPDAPSLDAELEAAAALHANAAVSHRDEKEEALAKHKATRGPLPVDGGG